MTKLGPPAIHHLNAAEGWLGLGSAAEAIAELAQIEPSLQRHPEVLEMKWQILASEGQWSVCAEVGAELVTDNPDRAFGWIHRAYALRRTPGGGLKSAYDSLVPAADKFPEIWLIPYNLACYECQLGNLTAAKTWLVKATARGELQSIKRMAQIDPDLVPLKAWISSL